MTDQNSVEQIKDLYSHSHKNKIFLFCVMKSGRFYACIFDPETKQSTWGELPKPLIIQPDKRPAFGGKKLSCILFGCKVKDKDGSLTPSCERCHTLSDEFFGERGES